MPKMTPPPFIWFNGTMMPWADARVHVMTHALHYGSSVFEGIRVYDTPEGTCLPLGKRDFTGSSRRFGGFIHRHV